jgi:hypothetical protein
MRAPEFSDALMETSISQTKDRDRAQRETDRLAIPMIRGIERILLGRDPREAWLFIQRFCGVCTTVHALASCVPSKTPSTSRSRSTRSTSAI